MKTIKITINDDNSFALDLDPASAITFPDFLTTMLSAILASARQLPDTPEVKEEVYDMINFGASNILSEYAPEIEMRPNLTSDAILKAENELLKEDKEAKYFKAAQPKPKKNKVTHIDDLPGCES